MTLCDRLACAFASIGVLAILAGCGSGGTSSPEMMPVSPATVSGKADSSYGGGSITIAGLQSADTSVAVDGTGRTLVVAGNYVWMYNANGSLGWFFQDADFHSAAAFDFSGNAYVASSSHVSKWDAAGRNGSAFGTNGYAYVSWISSSDAITTVGSIIPASNGSLYLAADVAYARLPRTTSVVKKLDAGGAVVWNFGDGGSRVVADSGASSIASAVLGPSDALFLAIRTTPSATSRMTVVKMDSAGSSSGDFGVAGTWTGPRDGCTSDGVAIDAQGGVLVAGSCISENIRTAVLVKLDARGVPIPTFGNAGTLENPFATPSDATSSTASRVTISSKGAIYAGGIVTSPAPACGHGVIVALDGNGARLKSFADSGILSTTDGSAIKDLMLDASDRLYFSALVSDGCNTGQVPALRIFRLI